MLKKREGESESMSIRNSRSPREVGKAAKSDVTVKDEGREKKVVFSEFEEKGKGGRGK